MELGADAWNAALAALGPQMPRFECRVDISLTFYVKPHAKALDGLYRPLDPSNVGGECIKSILDYSLVKTGIISDDDYKHVRYVILAIEPVAELSSERIEVVVIDTGEDVQR